MHKLFSMVPLFLASGPNPNNPREEISYVMWDEPWWSKLLQAYVRAWQEKIFG